MPAESLGCPFKRALLEWLKGEAPKEQPPFESQPKPGQEKVSKGRSQPEIAAAAFLVLYMVRGLPFLYRVLIMAQVSLPASVCMPIYAVCRGHVLGRVINFELHLWL